MNALSGYAQAIPSPPVVGEQPQLSRLNDRVSNAINSAQEIAARAHVLADRVLGSRPEPVSGDAKHPTPTCDVARLDDGLDVLNRTLGDVHDQLRRLETL